VAHALVATREATVVHVYNTAMISKRVHFVQREAEALWVTARRVLPRRIGRRSQFSRTNTATFELSRVTSRGPPSGPRSATMASPALYFPGQRGFVGFSSEARGCRYNYDASWKTNVAITFMLDLWHSAG
jgi:hypothetical protein